MFRATKVRAICFKNSTPELNALVELARASSGMLWREINRRRFSGAERSISFVARKPGLHARNREAVSGEVGHASEPMLCQIGMGRQ